MTAARPHVRAPAGDIEAVHWQGGPLDCSACCYVALRELPGELGCEPGHACMQDVYARRIDRFFRWHPELSDDQLTHPYFEVRAIAATFRARRAARRDATSASFASSSRARVVFPVYLDQA